MVLAAACATSERFAEQTSCLVGGAEEPGLLRLSGGEVNSIVALRGTYGSVCTGVLVTESSVITAAHCARYADQGRIEVVIGRSLSCPIATAMGTFTALSSDRDIALVNAPGLPSADLADPLAWNEYSAGEAWNGSLVQLAGFGTDSFHPPDAKQFAVETLTNVANGSIYVTGSGNSGACSGDSGGPLLGRAPSGEPLILGILSQGSASCLGEDEYVDLAAVKDWLRARVTRPTWKGSCGAFDDTGGCLGKTAIRCDSDNLVADVCDSDSFCGWTGRGHYGCLQASASECEKLDQLGRCSAGIAQRCDRGLLLSEDCAASGKHCHVSPTTGQATCGIR